MSEKMKRIKRRQHTLLQLSSKTSVYKSVFQHDSVPDSVSDSVPDSVPDSLANWNSSFSAEMHSVSKMSRFSGTPEWRVKREDWRQFRASDEASGGEYGLDHSQSKLTEQSQQLNRLMYMEYRLGIVTGRFNLCT